MVLPPLGLAFLLNWITIRKRHEGLMDWTWSVVAAAAILIGCCALVYIADSGRGRQSVTHRRRPLQQPAKECHP